MGWLSAGLLSASFVKLTEAQIILCWFIFFTTGTCAMIVVFHLEASND
jgi:hypothetical protein